MGILNEDFVWGFKGGFKWGDTNGFYMKILNWYFKWGF